MQRTIDASSGNRDKRCLRGRGENPIQTMNTNTPILFKSMKGSWSLQIPST